MYNIPFSNITLNHINGDWLVESRQLSTSDPTASIAHAIKFIFAADDYLELLPEGEGSWALKTEETMNRPYLLIEVFNESWKALITRLFINTDTRYTYLNLYFDTGMELTLVKFNNKYTDFGLN
ncbi:hypothetical protein [Adhaeribacter aquaticus]|uniref:hypothetical protein n=1 Tax=Adhaeribacter aquaticus TaxID=299567 RepID=UPI00040F5357|nr:hypothetical protein [Adhaeribacter aquaticus]